jgi:ASC-1-like (ASCH) protein
MEMKLDTIYFNFIKNGEKLYEIRVFDKKRREIKLLDRVKFVVEPKD